MRPRPTFLALAALASAGALSALALGTGCQPNPPNLLLVTMDTTRIDAIGAYGQSAPVTPNLDRLAAEGVRFTRAYSVTPLTIPAHSSIMTGMYPPRHGVQDNGDFFLGDEATTLAERLKVAGYATMASVGAEVTSHHWGFAQGFDAYLDGLSRTSDVKENRWSVERPGSEVVADARGWFATLPRGTRWFAWAHFFDAHHPYEPVEPFRSRFLNQPYLAEVATVDAHIGELLDAMPDRDNTCVVVVADHGESLGAHGEGMHGVLLYDETTHIPMIAWCGSSVVNGVGTPRVVDTPVSLVDVAPSLLGLAQTAFGNAIDGLPLFGGVAGTSAAREVYVESLYAWRHYGWAPQKALVTNTHKLIDSTTPELYGRDDVREASDLAETDPGTVTTLRSALNALGATMVPSGAAQRAELDPERVAQLEALGYITTDAAPTGPADALPDPVDRLPVLARVEQARQALRKGDLANVRSQLEALVTEEPGLVEPQMMLVGLRARAGDLTGAIALAESLDAAHPSAQSKATLGALRMQARDSAGAIAALREAVEKDPYLATAWPAYLQALFLANDPGFADEVARARKLLPDAPAPAAFEGLLRAARKDAAGAEPLVLAALARDPMAPFMNHALGMVRRQQGDLLAAEAAFQEEVRLHAPAVASRRALVELYVDQKRADEQLAQLDAILAVVPADAPTLHSKAQALFNLKRYPEAKSAVDACTAAAPTYPGCAMLDANVLDKLGRKKDAVDAYQRALALAGQAPAKP